jgi:predicted anti-sigma-YlaC factor YlaD
MTCQDAIGVLSDYLELALGPEILADLERHLSDCAPCMAYLNTFRATRGMAARAARVEMPDELKARLRTFLIDRLR